MFKSVALFALCTVLAGPSSAQSAAPAAPQPPATAKASCPSILNQHVNRLQDDAPQDLCQYSGRVALVVNTASYCGFTKQYWGWKRCTRNTTRKGLVVLGFPSNDFGKQEPGSSKEIADFCYNTYGVKFPMFARPR